MYLERHTLEFKTSHDLQEERSIGNVYVSLRSRGRAERVVSTQVAVEILKVEALSQGECVA